MSDEANIIQQHPEFPFGETLARDRIERWEESFDRRPEPDEPTSLLLQEFLEFVERYAFLERIVQGEIRYELPVHPRFLEQRERSDDPLEQQAAELAEAEAELLGSPDVPSMTMTDEAEDIGIKLLTTSEPATTEPAATEPATTEPATTEPPSTEPAPTTTEWHDTPVPLGIDLTCRADGTSVTCAWSPWSGDGFARFLLLRSDGTTGRVPFQTSDPAVTATIDAGLAPGSYSYVVIVLDSHGTTLVHSNGVTVQIGGSD